MYNIIIETTKSNYNEQRKRCCCNCGNNIRVEQEDGYVRCECAIDGHYIGYVACFEDWCRRWRRERKWDKL